MRSFTPPAGEAQQLYEGQRRLIVAIILRAIEESRAGNAEASAWLTTTGSDWCDQFLGLLVPPAAWAQIDLRAARQRLAADPSEVARHQEMARARRRRASKAERQRQKQARGQL